MIVAKMVDRLTEKGMLSVSVPHSFVTPAGNKIVRWVYWLRFFLLPKRDMEYIIRQYNSQLNMFNALELHKIVDLFNLERCYCVNVKIKSK